MKTLRRIWWWLIFAACKTALPLGYYRIKSALYRRLFERAYANDRTRLFYDFDSIAAVIKSDRWRPDTWKSGWDAVSYPGKAQRVFDGELEPDSNFDCDDFAIWLVDVLSLATSVGSIAAVNNIAMMSCIWGQEDSMSVGGHNVCVFSVGIPRHVRTMNHGHIGVGGVRQFLTPGVYVMDYGMPVGPFETPEDAARDVCRRYGGAKARPIVSSRHDRQVRHIRTVGL